MGGKHGAQGGTTDLPPQSAVHGHCPVKLVPCRKALVHLWTTESVNTGSVPGTQAEKLSVLAPRKDKSFKRRCDVEEKDRRSTTLQEFLCRK